jgi:hypothetical protein
MQRSGLARLLRLIEMPCRHREVQMGNSDVLSKVTVREVTGVFASRTAALPAVDDLLIAGFDRADIDVLADGQQPQRLGQAAIPAVELADVPDAPRQEIVTPEDTAGVFAVCVAVVGSIGAMIGAIGVIASGGTTWPTILAAIIGGTIGCGVGYLIARGLGWHWRDASEYPAAGDGLVLWVRVRTPDRERTALRILTARGAEAVRVHEIEIARRLEDLPLSSLRPDPWLGNERLGQP